MTKILVKKEKESANNWQFKVEVEENDSKTTHQVTVDKDYFANFSNKFSSPEALVKKSFEFLLARESKESILSQFNLSLIKTYFPNYEQKI